MDKHTLKAFEKMQRAEHYIRAAREQRALGKISSEEMRKRVEEVQNRFALTVEEQRAYDMHGVKRQGK